MIAQLCAPAAAFRRGAIAIGQGFKQGALVHELLF